MANAYGNPYEPTDFQKGFDPSKGVSDFESSWEKEYEEYCNSLYDDEDDADCDEALDSFDGPFKNIEGLSYNDYLYCGIDACNDMQVIYDGDGNAHLMPDPDYFSVPLSKS